MSERQTKAGNQECFANLQNLQIDPWDMLNNFCFHVYAQNSLFIGENDNEFFYLAHTHATDIRVHRAGF